MYTPDCIECNRVFDETAVAFALRQGLTFICPCMKHRYLWEDAAEDIARSQAGKELATDLSLPKSNDEKLS